MNPCSLREIKRSSMALAALVALAGGVLAQNGEDRAQAELARSQRALQQNRAEVDRLLDMRLRHDLGLPGEEDSSQFRPTAPVTTEAMERSRQELRDEDAATAALLDRYKKLKNDVDQLQADAAATAQADQRTREFLVVPPANTALTRPAPQLGPIDAGMPSVPLGEGRDAARPAPAAVPVVVDLGLDPVRGQIHGSQDHQRVAQALFKAGQVLMDRAQVAREQQMDAAAKELDARAKERLVRAIDELGPLLQQKEPPYPALFYLGRCRELLFRWSQRYDGLSLVASTRDYQLREQEVREPFLAISARDTTKKGERDEIEVLGPWGMAAQTAMEHFRWLNLHAGYDPRAAIEALTWPGERDQ